ncbi:MAG: BadF/BadG/BcrA/BcrD ATPase family protein, partial [Armatimonadota bacterium]
MRNAGGVDRVTAEYVAGFDGGGTKTVCLLTDLNGHPIGVGYGGPGNVCTHPDTAREAYRSALLEAADDAGVDPGTCQFAVFGMAGYFAPAVAGGPEAAVAGLLAPGRVHVCSDMETALVGAVGTGAGIVVIAGTGSAACGRDGCGRFLKCGGWGYILDDEGSAFWIARQAVRAALDEYDGRGGPTILSRMLISHLGLAVVPDLEGYVYNLKEPNTGLAALAPVVVDAAVQESDAVARSILDEAGRRLALLAVTLIRRLDLQNVSALPVATVGGVLAEAHG